MQAFQRHPHCDTTNIKRGNTMAESLPLAIASKAIEGAKIRHPDCPPGRGATWPNVYITPREATLFAFAALEALENAGFKIAPKDYLEGGRSTIV
jgi:hypothetical protein